MAVEESVRRDYAPTGKLRVALNFGNRVLVGRDANRTPVGISVDLARALADELSLDLALVEFERAVDVSNAAQDDLWDACFLAVDPQRAKTIAFTHPYVRISGAYLVSAAMPGVLPEATIDTLFNECLAFPGYQLTVDLERQVVVRPQGEEIAFEVQAFRKYCLLNGLDDIGLTLRHADKIKAYEAERLATKPWLAHTAVNA